MKIQRKRKTEGKNDSICTRISRIKDVKRTNLYPNWVHQHAALVNGEWCRLYTFTYKYSTNKYEPMRTTKKQTSTVEKKNVVQRKNNNDEKQLTIKI